MYALTKESRRARGQAVACELVRAVLRGQNTLTEIRHNEEMRARLSEGFRGYLVTECGPMTEAEILATAGGRHCAPGFGAFSARRGDHAPRRYSVLSTGFEYHGRGNSLDAPENFAAGSLRYIERFGMFPRCAERGQ